MEIKTEKMYSNEIRKIGLIITRISDKLGWDVSGYGEASVNPNSGNAYIWLEDYRVTPYIGLGSDDKVEYLFNCPECGEEWDIPEAKVKAGTFPKSCISCKKAV